jgi:hypothetical protein
MHMFSERTQVRPSRARVAEARALIHAAACVHDALRDSIRTDEASGAVREIGRITAEGFVP